MVLPLWVVENPPSILLWPLAYTTACAFTTVQAVMNAVYTVAWLPDNCTRLVDSLKQIVDASKFPTLVGQFTHQPLSTILL